MPLVPSPRARALVGALTLSVGLGAVGAGATAAAATKTAKPKATTVTLVAYDSFATSKDVWSAFTARTGITVKVLLGGDTGELVNKAVLTKDKPLGDVLWGVDNTFLSRALKERLFEPYRADELTKVATRFRSLVPKHEVTPVDFGDVCVNYDKKALAAKGIAAPATLDDLAKPAYKNLLVVQNPATSSPGLAFVLATISRYGESGWKSYWTRLKANGVKVVNGWDTAWNTEFSGGGGDGSRPLVVSYASSPPAAVFFAPDPKPTESSIGVLTESCFRQVEFAGVLRKAAHPAQAKKVLDFLISRQFQEDMPLNMFVFPVRDDAKLPEVFAKFAVLPLKPLELTPAKIAAGRDRWTQEWTTTVLR